MIIIARKKSLTKLFESMDKYRVMYAQARRTEFAINNANKNKPLKKSDHYKNKFLKNYNEYYKNGGQRKRQVYDYTYKNMTGNDPVDPDLSKRKPSGKKKRKVGNNYG